MAAPTHVQQWNSTGNGPLAIPLTGVTSGNTLALIMFQTLAATRTYTVSDSVDGAWTAGPLANISSRYAQIFYKIASSSGSKTVTVSPNGGSTEIHVSVVEIGASTASVSSTITASGVTSHPCAAVGEIDTLANSYILSGSVLNASGSTYTPNASCTLIREGDLTNGFLAQYRRSSGALTDERSIWTSGTARDSGGVSMAFVDSSGGGFNAAWASGSNVLISGGL